MNRLRVFAIATALIAGSSALASATPDRDHHRDRDGYVYRNGGYYNDHDRDDRWRYNDHDRDDRWRYNDHDRDDRWRNNNRWRYNDHDRDDRRGWWNRHRDRD
ncbi:MAG TPA: hypothetical protein VG759_23465 [Candidatus Angelobacter sp.]|nr:hypothetical protein [Candidatus Angelobacter sp.]